MKYQILIVFKFAGNVATSIAQFATSGEAEQAIANLDRADDELTNSSKIETYKLWKGKE